MTAISAVSKLSWRAIREDYSLEKYEEELEKIRTRKRNYTPWQVAVGAGFACGGFCIQFGCDWPAFFYASVAAILGFRLRAVLNDLGSNHFMNIAVACLRLNVAGMGFHVHIDARTARTAPCRSPFRYAVASADGLRSFHRPRRPAD